MTIGELAQKVEYKATTLKESATDFFWNIEVADVGMIMFPIAVVAFFVWRFLKSID